MSALKATFLFDLATNVASPNAVIHRVGGWSESWYEAGGSITISLLRTWAAKRAPLLGQGASIIGARVQQVDPAGPSQSYALAYPGTSTNQTDIPQMALLCKATGIGVRNTKNFMLRGIPDGQVSQGEFNPTADYKTAMQNFFKYLKEFSWEFRGNDLAQVAHPLVSIDANGICTFAEPHGLNAGDYVKILRATDLTGRKRGGKFFVLTAATTTTCALSGWGFGACIKGAGRKFAIVYPTVETATADRISTRKVGGVFNRYRGRASKRS